MKKLVVAGVCAVAVGVVAPAPVAQATGDRCATKSEFRKIKNGMSKVQVARTIGDRGTRFFDFEEYETREYASCRSENGFVMVSFENNKVIDKSAVWA